MPTVMQPTNVALHDMVAGITQLNTSSRSLQDTLAALNAVVQKNLAAKKDTATEEVQHTKSLQLGTVAQTAAKLAAVGATAALGGLVGGLRLTQTVAGLATHTIEALIGAINSSVVSFVKMYSPVEVIKFERAVADLNAAIGRALVPLLERFVVVVRGIGDVIASLSPSGQQMIAVMTALGVGLVTATGLTGVFIATVGSGLVGLTILAEAFGVATAAATAGISLIIGAIAGIAAATLTGGAAIAFVSKDLASVQNAVKSISITARQVIEALAQAFGRVVTAMQPLIDTVSKFAGEMSGPFVDMIEMVSDVIAEAIVAVLPVVQRLVPVVSEVVRTIMPLVGPAVLGALVTGLGMLAAAMAPLVGIATAVGTVLYTVAKAFEAIGGVVGDFFGIERKRPRERVDPTGRAEGLAVRSVQTGGINEAISRAQQNALMAGRKAEDSPAMKSEGHLSEIRKYLIEGNWPEKIAKAIVSALPNPVPSSSNVSRGIEALSPVNAGDYAGRMLNRMITG